MNDQIVLIEPFLFYDDEPQLFVFVHPIHPDPLLGVALEQDRVLAIPFKPSMLGRDLREAIFEQKRAYVIGSSLVQVVAPKRVSEDDLPLFGVKIGVDPFGLNG